MFINVFYSSMAAMFFAFLFNVPRKSIPVTAIIAGIGYMVFIGVEYTTSTLLASFFFGALVMAILSEVAARMMKLATTTFITIAVIPLVPGLGLYQTMQFLVQSNYSAALETGAETLLAAGAIAMAVAITTLLVKLFIKK